MHGCAHALHDVHVAEMYLPPRMMPPRHAETANLDSLRFLFVLAFLLPTSVCAIMFVTFRRKYIQVAVVLGLLLVILVLLLLSSTFSLTRLKDFNYMDSLALSMWMGDDSGRFDATLSLLDSDSKFNRRVLLLIASRRQNDYEDRYWTVDTELKDHQTEMSIPEYYSLRDDYRPDASPFDPRWTLAFYYHHIWLQSKTHPGKQVVAPFHWVDWVDMTILNLFIFEPSDGCKFLDQREQEEELAIKKEKPNKHESLDPAQFCVLDADIPEGDASGNRMKLGFSVTNYPGRMSTDRAKVAGRAYLYTSAPAPVSVIFLTRDGSYNITTAARSKLLHNGLVDTYMTNSGEKRINTLSEFRKLQKYVPAYKDKVVNDYEIHLRHEDFVMNPTSLIGELTNKQDKGETLSALEKLYLESLQYSVLKGQLPPKYFSEARIFDTLLGDHYDWRFFGGFKVGSSEQATTLHRMIRTWLSFCRKQGITTWMAHGSLLLWYWNGIAFPWDNDIDVQVPVMDLHRLSLQFNQSLVVEDAEDGFGRYFLDCGTFITTRNHANGQNNIDARFIDIDSGLYIDITALAVSSDSAPDRYHGLLNEATDAPNEDINTQLQVYNCRNKHFSSLAELSPLVRSYVEGEVGYIPKRYSDILTTEYNNKGIIEKYFSSRLFMPQLRLWVHQDLLRFFLRYRKEWLAYYSSLLKLGDAEITKPQISGDLTKKELSTLLSLREKDLIDLLHNDQILMEYVSTRDMTSVHENEIMRLLFGKSTAKVVFLAPDFPPLKYEPFLFRMRHDYSTFETEIDRYLLLLEKYNSTGTA